MKDLMIDIETLGVCSGCVVCEIGAVLFDAVSGEIGTGHERILLGLDIRSQLSAGLVSDPGTVEWHEKAGRMVDFYTCKQLAAESCAMFTNWVQLLGAERYWAKGGDFEWPILRELYRKLEVPFFSRRYSHFYCMRGLVDVAERVGGVRLRPEFDAVAHSGLEDAVQQATVLCEALRILRNDGVLA